ncbi:hypothetical protein FA13DRAFT_1337469 [Coprinellus micaceus]|uniref:WKF domain-containing protein n=1 Tax=Coprinellus micaceus TaxID=71717 RepID=A0A4Y7TMH2_COPMI|nr:hypothetical protein FA13DRAFT_1337469 [Coprinellus micaceus]
MAPTVNSRQMDPPQNRQASRTAKIRKSRVKKSPMRKDTSSSPKKKKSKSKSGSTSKSSPTSPPNPRKNRTDFPDPHGDESLTDQARKALDYAFLQFNKPSEWKFNKAKQNWLIRNVWSSEAIPDNYLRLATKYLTQVQGGSRDKLQETCKAAIAEPLPSPAPANDEPKDTKPSDTPEEAERFFEKTEIYPQRARTSYSWCHHCQRP